MPVSVGKADCLQSNDDRNINRSDTGKIRKGRNNMDNVDEIIDKIAKDIEEDHDNKVAIAFTKSIGKLLNLNGVTAHYTEYNSDVMAEDEISKRYGIVFDSIDFTEHDKGFKDEIKRLQESIKERDSYINQLKHDSEKLENVRMRCTGQAIKMLDRGIYEDIFALTTGELKARTSTIELPFDAIEVANFLINEEYECDMLFTGRKTKRRKYEIEDLEQIAEHLLVYCKHNNIEEE